MDFLVCNGYSKVGMENSCQVTHSTTFCKCVSDLHGVLYIFCHPFRLQNKPVLVRSQAIVWQASAQKVPIKANPGNPGSTGTSDWWYWWHGPVEALQQSGRRMKDNKNLLACCVPGPSAENQIHRVKQCNHTMFPKSSKHHQPSYLKSSFIPDSARHAPRRKFQK